MINYLMFMYDEFLSQSVRSLTSNTLAHHSSHFWKQEIKCIWLIYPQSLWTRKYPLVSVCRCACTNMCMCVCARVCEEKREKKIVLFVKRITVCYFEIHQTSRDITFLVTKVDQSATDPSENKCPCLFSVSGTRASNRFRGPVPACPRHLVSRPDRTSLPRGRYSTGSKDVYEKAQIKGWVSTQLQTCEINMKRKFSKLWLSNTVLCVPVILFGASSLSLKNFFAAFMLTQEKPRGPCI